MGPNGLRALRATCHELQNAVDGRVERLKYIDPATEDGRNAPLTSPAKILGSVQRFLDRDGRPRALALRLNADRSISERQQIGHGVLTALAAAPHPRPLESLALQGVPLTADLVAAIAAAAPQLQQLELYVCRSWWGKAAAEAAAIAAVVRSAAPGLRRLTLWYNWMQICEAPLEPQLVEALQECRSLERITLWRDDTGGKLLQALQLLPRVPVLELRTYDRHSAPPERGLRTGFFDGDVPQGDRRCEPGGVTHLAVDRVSAPEELVPYLPSLGTLTALELWDTPFATGDLQLLQSLPSLQRVVVKSIDAENRQVAPPPSSLPLPPRLQSLDVTGVLDPRVLLALQLPPSLTRLVGRGLVIVWVGPGPDPDNPIVEGSPRCDEALEHMAAVLAGLRLLADRGLFDGSALRSSFVLRDFPLDSSHGIPGGFRALAAALGRLGLRGIKGCDLPMSPCTDPAWFEALAHEMPDLQELQWTEVRLGDLATLRRLRRLRQVRLVLSSNTNLEDSDELCGRLFDFVAALPDLKRLSLKVYGNAGAWPWRQALTKLQRDFRALGDRAKVSVKVYLGIPRFYLGGAEDVNLVDGPGSVDDGEHPWREKWPLLP